MPFKILFFVAGFALWVRAIVDIIESEFEGSNMKLVWLLVVLLMPVLGTILYMTKGDKMKMPSAKAPEEGESEGSEEE